MVKGGADNRSFRNIRRKKKAKKFPGRQRYDQSVVSVVNVEEPDANIDGEGINSSCTTDTACTSNVTLDPVVDSDSRPVVESTNVVINHGETVSQRKIQELELPAEENELLSGYRLMDIDLLLAIIKSVACPKCLVVGSLVLTQKAKYGLAFKFSVCCKNCKDWENQFSTSTKQSKKFDINYKAVYAMRRCGKGYQGLRRFLALINHPPPMTEKNYRKISHSFTEATRAVALKSMNDAAEAIRQNGDNVVDIGVSVDGTWQRRGFSSKNGAVAAISIDTGKVLDVACFSRYCQGCVNMEMYKTSEPDRYELWRDTHKCSINHAGSAPAMEKEGVKQIFSRSISDRKLRYTEYYGDGDSKGFASVKDTYHPIPVIKRECIGHIQKRVGNNLRKLKKDVSGLGGADKLTDSMVDRLQNYYGIAIRSNVGDLQKMKKAIGAVLFHCASSKENEWHDNCPKGSDSWCKYQQDISFNGMIWQRIPKDVRVNAATFEMGVYDALSHFNLGNIATVNIYNHLGFNSGYYTLFALDCNNKKRVNNSVRKSTEIYKNRRKYLRGRTKRKGDKNKESEGVTYKPGEY